MVIILKPNDDATKILDKISQFLAERGMKVSERKTKITASTDGFDFLGWHFKVQNNGKFRCVPSVDNFKTFRKKVKTIVNNSSYGSKCDQWEETTESVEKVSDEKFQIARDTELQRIFDEHDAVNQQFQNIIDRTMIWADKVRTSHANKSAFIKQMTRNFNETLDTVGNKIKEQEQTWLAEIELLREKVAVLQQQNAGEILEPEYLPRDFNRATDISNGIAHVLRHFYNVSLRVNGFEETEGLLKVGYAYSKSLDPKVLLDIFDKYGKDITKSLGLYSISATVDKISPTFVLKIKSERPKPESDEDIYKQGLIPAFQFAHQIFLATDHTAKGKPTMRVMSSTGGGKGIAVKNVLVDLPS